MTTMVAEKAVVIDKVTEELLNLAAVHDGILHVKDVVEAARPATSILHDHFEWDDSKAAVAYRFDQARQLIRCQVQYIGDEEEAVQVRVFVSLPSDRTHGGGYSVLTQVLSDKDKKAEMLADALRELEAFKKRYAALKELAEVVKPISVLLSRMKR